MGLIDDLKNELVFLDTAPLIFYSNSGHPKQQLLESIFASNLAGDFTFLASSITLLEFLVLPFKRGQHQLAQRYEKLLCSSATLRMHSIAEREAVMAARIRAEYGFKTPDALQCATAVCCGASFFLTNDKQLRRFTEIEILYLNELTS